MCVTDKDLFCVRNGKYFRPWHLSNSIAQAKWLHLPLKGNSHSSTDHRYGSI